MEIRFNAKDKADIFLKMNQKVMDGLKIGGVFEVVCKDKDGNVKWKEVAHNLFTNAGLNHVLNVVFHNTTQVITWYIGLYTDTEPSASWTNGASWTEFTSYTGNRKEFVESESTSQSLDNSANKASFAITGSGTIYGAGLVDADVGNGTVLICAANFSQGSRAVQNGDTVEVQYTCSAADDSV